LAERAARGRASWRRAPSLVWALRPPADDAMDIVIHQITALSTKNDSDLKKLKDFLRNEQETLKTNASGIEQALQSLDPVQNTLGVSFLLAAQLSTSTYSDARQTFAYVSAFLRTADEQQVKKGSVPFMSVCKSYAQMAIDLGQQMMLRSLMPLRCALETLRPNAETWTPVHTEFLRVCLQCKAYHLGAAILDVPVYDMPVTSGNCAHVTPESFLCYFYYGALLRIGVREFSKAVQMLLVVLTWPASCLSATQADAYKKYVLVSLKSHGEVKALPVYTSHIIQKFEQNDGQNDGYVVELTQAFKQGDATSLQRIADEKAAAIKTDDNDDLVKQVLESLQRHKLLTLTKTYLTLSMAEIAKQVGLPEASPNEEVEALLFDMISGGEINARIDQTTGNVSFDEGLDDLDIAMVPKMQDRLQQILGLAQRVANFEREVVSSEAYIRKTTAMEGGAVAGGAGAAPAGGGYDFMDM